MQLIILMKKFAFYYVLLIFFSKYAWVIPLKGKKGVTIVNVFQNILNDSERAPNKKMGRKRR